MWANSLGSGLLDSLDVIPSEPETGMLPVGRFYFVMVVRAVLGWTGRDSYGIKRLPKAAQLFMDSFVTLYRWILAAKTAPKHGRASA